MNLKSELDSELGRLIQAITRTEGIVAIILFGSRARGDYDEHSDYDLLVVFEDDEIMWRNRGDLYRNIGNLGLFTQVLTRSVKELTEKTEPTFLQNILEHGTILYLRYPFMAPAFSSNLAPMAVVSYSLVELSHKEKMRVNYCLFGKQNRKGLVGENGGKKLGDGCFMIPAENLEKALIILKEFGVHFNVIRVYASQLIT
jgi:predicted nucleotidyltransferase